MPTRRLRMLLLNSGPQCWSNPSNHRGPRRGIVFYCESSRHKPTHVSRRQPVAARPRRLSISRHGHHYSPGYHDPSRVVVNRVGTLPAVSESDRDPLPARRPSPACRIEQVARAVRAGTDTAELGALRHLTQLGRAMLDPAETRSDLRRSTRSPPSRWTGYDPVCTHLRE